MVTIEGIMRHKSSIMICEIVVVKRKLVQRLYGIDAGKYGSLAMEELKTHDFLGAVVQIPSSPDAYPFFKHGLFFYLDYIGRVAIAPIPTEKSIPVIKDNQDLFKQKTKIDDLMRMLEFME